MDHWPTYRKPSRASALPTASPRSGAVAVVTSVILGRPACLECIATRSALAMAEVEAVLERIASVVESHREPTRCRVCGETKAAFSITRPP